MSLFSSSSNDKNEITTVWTMYRGDLQEMSNGHIDSPTFGSKNMPQIKFRFRFSRESLNNNSGGISLHLMLVQVDRQDLEEEMNVQCKIGVVDIPNTGQEGQTRLDKTITGTCKISENLDQQLLCFKVTDMYELFGMTSVIIIACEVKMLDLNSKNSTISQQYKCLAEDFSSLRHNPIFSDVLLHTTLDGQDFPAHKAILSVRSKVFAAMFGRVEYVEADANQVEIPDVTGEVLDALLAYIYCGDTSRVPQMAAELLEAADKYDIGPLVQVCIHQMCTTICDQSAAQILYLADLHQLSSLKTLALEYIGNHAKEVRQSPGWNEFISKNNHLIESLFDHVAEKIIKK